MKRTIPLLVCFFTLGVGSISTHAEPKTWTWHAAGFRLTCLPYQDSALLEPYYLDHIPDTAHMPAFKAMLAKQGIYIGDNVINGNEETPLEASCNLGKHHIKVEFGYNSNMTLGRYEKDGKFTTLVSRQHCASVSYLTLKSLKVDGTEWHKDISFAHDCLSDQVLRMQITPTLKLSNICTQTTGGQLENAPLPIAYSPIQLDEHGNPPLPTVTCKTIFSK